MANAVEASASTARPRKQKRAAQGETAAARRDGAHQGNCQKTKKGESSRLPKNENLTGTLEHRYQTQYPTIPYRVRDTGGEIQGEEHKEETGEQRNPQRRTRCGLLSRPSDSEVLEERSRERTY